MKTSKWFWVSLVFLAVIIIMAKCMYDKNNVVVVENPVIAPSERLDNNVKKNEDSSNAVIKSAEGMNDILQKEKKELSINLRSANEDIRLLEKQVVDLENQLEASDLTNSIKSTTAQLSAATSKAMEDCNSNIANLNSQLFGKDIVINEERKKYSKLKLNYDTCIDNQNKLEKYSDKLEREIKPRNKVAIGMVANVFPVFGIGGGATFIHKKGFLIEAEAMTMNKDLYVKIGGKFIISLRKK